MSASATPRTPAQAGRALALLGLALLVLVYPALLDDLASRVGLRTTALALASISLVSTLAGISPLRERLALGPLPGLGLAALAGLSALTGQALPLRLIPAWVHGLLFHVFQRSLRTPPSAIERLARAIEPAAPDFIAPYCRRTTRLWSLLFACNAVVLAAVAVLASPERWRSIASLWIYLPIAAGIVLDFFVRKAYFRYYWHQGPFDRFWSRIFPAEATPMGRRSAAHIARVRAQQAGPADEPGS